MARKGQRVVPQRAVPSRTRLRTPIAVTASLDRAVRRSWFCVCVHLANHLLMGHIALHCQCQLNLISQLYMPLWAYIAIDTDALSFTVAH